MKLPEIDYRAGPAEGSMAALFQRVVDSLRERFVVIDAQFKICIVNDSALPNHFVKSDALGRALFDIYPNLAEQGFKKLIDEVFKTGEPHIEMFARHTTIDSFTGYHHRKILPIKNSEHHVEFVIVIVESAHEEKLARQYAQEMETTYRTLTETLQLVSFELDAVGKFVHISRAVLPVLGYSIEELIGKSFTQHIHPEDVRQMWNIYWQIVNENREFGVCQIRFQAKDGTYVHMRWSIHPMLNVDGTIIGCRGVGENISDDAARISTYKEKLLLYQQALLVAPQALLIVQEGRVSHFNRAAHQLFFGRSTKKIPHQKFSDLFVESDAISIATFVENLPARGRASMTARVRAHDGVDALYVITGIQIRDAVVIALELVRA